MREFLYSLLTNYGGFKSWYSTPDNWVDLPLKPFNNYASKPEKYKDAFTKNNLAHLLMATHLQGNVDRLGMFLEGKYGAYGETYFSFVYENCGKVNFTQGDCCYENMLRNEWQEGCEGCKIKWMYNLLRNVERSYSDDAPVYNFSEYELNKEQKKLVSKVYKKIIAFEDRYSANDTPLEAVADIYNQCLQCRTFPDVRDKKLSYIKWYTAHLMTWPPMKAALILNGQYNEQLVFDLLDSAVHIQSMLNKVEDVSLLYKMEIERIVSFLSCKAENVKCLNNFHNFLDAYKSVPEQEDTTRETVLFLSHSYILSTIIDHPITTNRISDQISEYIKEKNDSRELMQWSKEYKELTALSAIHRVFKHFAVTKEDVEFFSKLCKDIDLKSDPDMVMLLYTYIYCVQELMKLYPLASFNLPGTKSLFAEMHKAKNGEISLYNHKPVITFDKPSKYIRKFGDNFIPVEVWYENILGFDLQEVLAEQLKDDGKPLNKQAIMSQQIA